MPSDIYLQVLEAITTTKCQEKFHLESLETLGDSFLKFAATQQLFKTYQHNHEGLLSVKKEKIVSNAALCKLGCDRKLPVTFLLLFNTFFRKRHLHYYHFIRMILELSL